jgi:LPXTG-motif cell wall-anchored protein
MSLVAGVALAGLLAFALPASAYHADISGWASCSNGVHVVHWSFTNSQSNMEMTIDSATAAIGATPYPVDGYTSPVADGGSTNATSTVPGNVTGTIKATLQVSWPDHSSVISTGEVNIPGSCCECSTTTTTTEVTTTTKHVCGCTTTTTTQPATTTTEPVQTTTSSTEVLGSTTLFTTTTLPETTTTLGEPNSTVPTTDAPTTTLGEQGSTVPSTEPSTTTTAPIPVGTVDLPRTGGSVELPVIFGGLCIAAGAALALRKRSAWSRS